MGNGVRKTHLKHKKYLFIRTPKEIWNKLKKEFKFTIDVCASDKNHLLPKYYTKTQDALNQDWSGEVAYIHPMFDSGVGKFVKKAFNTKNFTGVFLIPASTNSKYFHSYIYHNPNCEIRFLESPTYGFYFGHENGKKQKFKRGYIKGLMIVIFKNG